MTPSPPPLPGNSSPQDSNVSTAGALLAVVGVLGVLYGLMSIVGNLLGSSNMLANLINDPALKRQLAQNDMMASRAVSIVWGLVTLAMNAAGRTFESL